MLNLLLANAYSKKVTLFIMGSFTKSIGAKNGDARIVIMGKRPRIIVSRRLKSILLMAWGEPQKPLGLPQCRQIRRISYLMKTKKQLDVYVGRKHITRKKKQQK